MPYVVFSLCFIGSSSSSNLKVGLLPLNNEGKQNSASLNRTQVDQELLEHIEHAYHLFEGGDKKKCRKFKMMFSIKVYIDFLGVWSVFRMLAQKPF